VSSVTVDHWVQREDLVQVELLVRLVAMEHLEPMELMEASVQQDQKDHEVFEDQMDTTVSQEFQVTQDVLGEEVIEVRQDQSVHQVVMESLAPQDLLAQLVLLELQEKRVQLEKMESPVQTVLMEEQERRATLEKVDYQDVQEMQVLLASWVHQVQKAKLDLKAFLETMVLKEKPV